MKFHKHIPAAFEKQRLIISDSTYIVVAESTDKGVVKYDGDISRLVLFLPVPLFGIDNNLFENL